MIVTVENLTIDFNENIQEMQRKENELKRLEKAIEESPYFKLLSGKTQMIGKGNGKVIKERSRRIHSNNIAYGIASPAISKIYDRFQETYLIFKEDPTYKEIFELNKRIAILRGRIMAKAHDLGHVPYGHEGEKAVNRFLSSLSNQNDIDAILNEHLKYFGNEYEKAQGHIQDDNAYLDVMKELFPMPIDAQLSFEHNELGAILLNRIIEENKIELSHGQTNWDEKYEVDEDKNEERKSLTMGVLGHSTSRTPFYLIENDIVAQIVRVGDKIEYINADYDEVAGLVNVNFNSEQKVYMSKSRSERIRESVEQITKEAFAYGKVEENNPTMLNLRKIRKMYEDVLYIYDGFYSDNVLGNLLKLYNKPDQLKIFYDNNKGIENMYPKENLGTIVKLFNKYRDEFKKLKDGKSISEASLQGMYARVDEQIIRFKGAIQGENSGRIFLMATKIMEYYHKHPEEIPEKIVREINPIDLIPKEAIYAELHSEYSPIQKTLEYVALMDDKSLYDEYLKLVRMRIDKGEEFGIEPITVYEVKNHLRKLYEDVVEKSLERTSGSHSLGEGQRLYTAKNREHENKVLTEKGRTIKKIHSLMIWKEFDEDKRLYEEMLKKDFERNPEKPIENFFYGIPENEEDIEDRYTSEEVRMSDFPSNSGSADNGSDYNDR